MSYLKSHRWTWNFNLALHWTILHWLVSFSITLSNISLFTSEEASEGDSISCPTGSGHSKKDVLHQSKILPENATSLSHCLFHFAIISQIQTHFYSLDVLSYPSHVANHFRLRKQNHTELNESFSRISSK